MDLELHDEHLELREAAVGALDRYAPLSLARRYLDGVGDATELWAQIRDLGWLGVGLDEDDPFGVPGLCLLAEQVGRRAAPTTLVDTALAVRIAMAGGSAWAERIVAGDPPLAAAILEPGRSWLSSAAIGTTARRVGADVVVSGEKTGVHHAGAVGLLAVLVELDGAQTLVFVDPHADGVTIMPLGGLDPSCAAARVVFDDVRLAEADIVAGPTVEPALRHAFDVAAVATTAEGLGAAAAALDLALAYALEREQYGRQIGTFQALQHVIAEQHVLRETAWASVLYAAAALEERTEDAGPASAVAKTHGAAAIKTVVEGALQVFGGVGFTREHDLHLVFRRALECAGRFGGATEHEQRVADTLLSRELALSGR
jgi:alkylation response protein AidB-like acyl-CoA dehydrogenase